MREKANTLMEAIYRERTYVPDRSAYKSNALLVDQFRETLNNFELLLKKAEEERHIGEMEALNSVKLLG